MTPRILFLTTHPKSASIFLQGQLAWLRESGFEVGVMASPGKDLDELSARERVNVFPVTMSRQPAPFRDIRALLKIARIMALYRPTIVNAGTPKAGLLGMLAARIMKVPVRIYTLHGLRLETVTGFQRIFLELCERIAAACAHKVVCVSESLRQRILDVKLIPEAKTAVLGHGSINGIDTLHFRPASDAAEKSSLRQQLHIPEDSLIVGFVGRFTRDKGIPDLFEAFVSKVLPLLPAARLLLVGVFEDGDPVPNEVRQKISKHPAVILPGFVADPAPYYRVMNVLAFASYREGLPTSPLEAAASAVPVVAYVATGTVNAVEDRVTGMLVACGDVAALGANIIRYLVDDDMQKRHGDAGRCRVETIFQNQLVWERWVAFYQTLLSRVRSPFSTGGT